MGSSYEPHNQRPAEVVENGVVVIVDISNEIVSVYTISERLAPQATNPTRLSYYNH